MKRIALVMMFTVGTVGCGEGGIVTEGGLDTTAEELAAGSRYLALGDSIVFGYNPNFDTAIGSKKISNFRGYPEVLDDKAGVVANPSCMGETSASFSDRTARDNGCSQWRRDGKALHVTYASTSQSQIAFAQSYLRANTSTKTVSVQIGANDLLLLQADCNGDAGCILGGLPGTLAKVELNLDKIFKALRSAYSGKIVAVNYYAPTQSDQTVVLGTKSLNVSIAKVAAANLIPVAGTPTRHSRTRRPVLAASPARPDCSSPCPMATAA